MDYENIRVAELKAIARERGLRGYSRLRKAELIALLRNNLQPSTRPTSREPRLRPPPRSAPTAPWMPPSVPAPRPPHPDPQTRPPKPTRAPPPPPA